MKKKQSVQGPEEPPQIATSSARPSIGRRDLLKGAALAVGVSGAAAFGVANAIETATPSLSPPGISNVRIIASDENAIVETTAGKVRGFTRNGIFTFLGIPYAGSRRNGPISATDKAHALDGPSQFHAVRIRESAGTSSRVGER